MTEVFKKNIVMDMEIETVTGLHIGGSSEDLKIGGTDNPLIMTRMSYKDSTIEVPYIPGSSIKGKMKSLLLTVYGARNGDKIEFANGHKDLEKIFGKPAESESKEINRTRLIVRDAFPTTESISKVMERDGRFIEVKGENSINAVTGMANPRFIDRVVPGVKFSGSLVLQVLEVDDEDRFLKYVMEGISLLQDTYLGGQGSRGYGKVSIKLVKKESRERDYYEKLGKDLSSQV